MRRGRPPVKMGELLGGRYRLEAQIGEGGMSSVYRARDTVLERLVAVKVLHQHLAGDHEYVERFRREARSIAKLTHPNIVTVIDRGELDGRQFIVFEHVSGETLKDLIEREAPLQVERALVLAHQIGRALAFAHEVGFVHRDVKPENVLLDAAGTPKVTDFGVARSLELDESLTETGTVLGTSYYIAPEQASGERVDERSDQYSLGVVLFELLTGEVPYSGQSAMAVAVRHLHDPVPSVRERVPAVSPRVDAIVARAMAKRARDRFPSMEAMTAALETCLREERGARASPDSEATGVLTLPGKAHDHVVARGRRSRRPRPLTVALVGLAAVALAAGLLVARLGHDGGGAGGGAGPAVRLQALSDYDPDGDDAEHPESVPRATDGDQATFWTTETYESFSKAGVGIVLDAGEAVEVGRLVLVSDEPGFTAKIQAGSSPEGPFEDVSEEQQARRRTTFELSADAGPRRYYVVWITGLEGRAHVNEVRARAAST